MFHCLTDWGDFMNRKLKAKIIEVYGKQADFAKACGKSDAWVSKIVTGRNEPNEAEKELIRRHLKIRNIDRYFINSKAA